MSFIAKKDADLGIRIKDDKFTVKYGSGKISFCSEEGINRFSHGPKEFLVRAEPRRASLEDMDEVQIIR